MPKSNEAPVTDVAGQVGGPSPEMQAQVDAEQAALIASIKAARAPAEAAERALLQAKIERARAAASGMSKVDIIATLNSLVERVEALEAKQ